MPFSLVAFDALTDLVGYLWIGYLRTSAIQDARGLDARRAGLVTGLVVLIPILYSASLLL